MKKHDFFRKHSKFFRGSKRVTIQSNAQNKQSEIEDTPKVLTHEAIVTTENVESKEISLSKTNTTVETSEGTTEKVETALEISEAEDTVEANKTEKKPTTSKRGRKKKSEVEHGDSNG